MTRQGRHVKVKTIARGFAYGFVLLLAAAVVSPANADILYNSLNGAVSTDLGTFSMGGAGPQGDSFSTGSTSFLLTDVFLKLQGVHDSASFTLGLYSDNNTSCASTCTGGPKTLLYTIATVADNSLSTSMA